MELDFVNGNEVQKAACRTAAHNLLNLPFDSINLKHTIEFTPDPLPSSHNEFAVTNYAYDDNNPITRIASVAPAWPEPWGGVKFLQETYAHELGHGMYAALPESARVAIAQMFGAASDSLTVLQPAGVAWQDRYVEAIAETFKDAFLPRRFRRYPNRTSRHIPIAQYPAFRALWRQAVPEITSGITIPAYDFDIFKRGGWTFSLAWPDSRLGLYQGRAGGSFGLWNFFSQSNFQATPVEVRGGHHLGFSWTIPRSLFLDASNPEGHGGSENGFLFISFEAAVGAEVLARWRLNWESQWVFQFSWASAEAQPNYQGYTAEDGSGPEPARLIWFGGLSGTVGQFPGTAGTMVNPPALTGGSGLDGRIPPLTFKNSFDTEWPKNELKLLQVKAFIDYGFLMEPDADYVELLRSTIPSFPFKQSGTLPGEGEPIVLPSASLNPEGATAGQKPHGRPVAGNAQ